MSSSPSRAVTALLPSDEVAALLGLQPQTLRSWRLRGLGPPYVRLGAGRFGRVCYRQEDIAKWLDSRTFANTAEETVRAHSRRSGHE